jgi:hypothetical protein
MRNALLLAAALALPCGAALADDGGVDGGPDTDAGCTFGEADCTDDPWMWCNEEGEWIETACLESELPDGVALTYSPCNCDPADPCGWVDDDYCDEGCLEVVDAMFDDTVDCTEYDGGADSDTDVDGDADTETDTGDAGPAASESDGCGCRTAGARGGRSLLSAVL